METYDIVIIGAGIAGAGLAWNLAKSAKVLVLEAEMVADYHTTGRSAAFFAESYGGPQIQPLTTASKNFFHQPPEGFCDHPLVSSRGALHVFRSDQKISANKLYREISGLSGITIISADEVLARVPILDAGQVEGGIYDPSCLDIDVAQLHHAYIKGAKRWGADFLFDSRVKAARSMVSGAGERCWHIDAGGHHFQTGLIVNASGAWADEVAGLCGARPIGVQPKRRTIVTVPNHTNYKNISDWPLILDVDERLYFKPEGDGFLISPADEHPSAPSDVQAELEDVAIAVERFSEMTGCRPKKILSKWAGLRTFAPDRLPVIGFDADISGFFWSAGQGGWGIQTSPAWSQLAAKIILGHPLDEFLDGTGIDPAIYMPARFSAEP